MDGVADRRVGAEDEYLDRLGLAGLRGEMEGGYALAVVGPAEGPEPVDVGAEIDEAADRGDMSVRRCPGEWRAAVRIGVGIGAELDEPLDRFDAVALGSPHERELGLSKLFGFVDAKPLRSPQPAERAAGYLSSFEVTETVKGAGRSLLNYVSRRLKAKSGVTMRVLRQVRIAWAWRAGLLPDSVLDGFELLIALCLLEQGSAVTRAP